MGHSNWTIRHSNWALQHPNWAIRHPNWAMPLPTWPFAIVIPFFVCNRDADRVTEWNTTLIEGRMLKRLSKDFIISYQVRKDSSFSVNLRHFQRQRESKKWFSGSRLRRNIVGATPLRCWCITYGLWTNVHINTMKFMTALKGHGNEADFLGFLQKLVPHESLTLPFGPFRFWLRIRGDIRIRKTTPRLSVSVIWWVADSPYRWVGE